jgi:hypothetical protein
MDGNYGKISYSASQQLANLRVASLARFRRVNKELRDLVDKMNDLCMLVKIDFGKFGVKDLKQFVDNP